MVNLVCVYGTSYLLYTMMSNYVEMCRTNGVGLDEERGYNQGKRIKNPSKEVATL